MPHADPEERRAWRRKWYANLDPQRKADRQAQATERIRKVRRYVEGVKMERGCIDCGYAEHPAALDFDHVRGDKHILVSFTKSIAAADREIEKCEVRCANCHRIKTWERLQNDQRYE